jgi:hypothetical protein
MSEPITLEDIYALFQRSQEEADRRFAEADRRAAESKAEFDRRMAESKAEFDRRMAESKAEADGSIKELRKAMGSLTSRWGQFVENLVAPGVLRIFQERGIAVQEVYQRVRSARGQANLEVDILAVDDDVAVIVEVKSRLTQNDIPQILNTLSQFKTAFPHYVQYRLYGAVAAIEIDGDVDTYADNQGLFVIVQAGDSIKIRNSIDFVPRAW